MATCPAPGRVRRLTCHCRRFDAYGTVEAQCRLDMGPVISVPYTLLPPVG